MLDGGLATALEQRGHRLVDALWSARLLIDHPDEVEAVHREYLAAGADCITTASYQATVDGFMRRGCSHAEAIELLVRATRLANVAVASTEDGTTTASPSAAPHALVAASVGPYGAYLADGSEYDGRYIVSDDELRAFHAERFQVLADSGADLLACETIPSAREAAVLLNLLEHHGDTWAWLTFSCPDGSRIWDGTPIEEVVSRCAVHRRVAGVGINCTDPCFAGELVARVTACVDLPVIAYPNSGEQYDPVGKRWGKAQHPISEDAAELDAPWLDGVRAAWEAGARVLGGCCRVGPAQIAELRARLVGGDFSARGG